MSYGTASGYAPPAYAPPPRDPTAVMGRRVVAYLIDFALVTSIEIALLAATKDRTFTGIPSGFSDACRVIRDESDFSGQCLQLGSRAWTWTTGAFILALGLATLVGLLNNVILQTATGASIGKMIMGLRVVTADGETAGLGRQFGRWMMLIVDAGLCFVGFFVAAFTHPHRRLGDSVASTYVVAVADTGRPLEFAAGPPPAMGQQFGQAFGQQPAYVPPPPGQGGWGQPQPQPGGWNQPAPAAPPQWGAAPQPQAPYQQPPQPPYGAAQPAQQPRPQWGESQPPQQPPAYQPPPPAQPPPAYQPPPPAQPPAYEPPPPAAPPSPPATDPVVESWWGKAVSDDEPDDGAPKQ
ncbi:MAG TPA: RDD family protein [Acidimicrobiia bacterium]|nr:RDD family protein [Acidimicrobiia bacterium]